jgi:DNA repair exonuclease SbcCD ATPase subunit
VRLNYEVKRNQSEATIDLLKFDYETGIDPFEEDGGGLAIVLGFTLRMAVWALQTNKTLPLMILDEPFKFLDKEKAIDGQYIDLRTVITTWTANHRRIT